MSFMCAQALFFIKTKWDIEASGPDFRCSCTDANVWKSSEYKTEGKKMH